MATTLVLTFKRNLLDSIFRDDISYGQCDFPHLGIGLGEKIRNSIAFVIERDHHCCSIYHVECTLPTAITNRISSRNSIEIKTKKLSSTAVVLSRKNPG